MHVYLSTCRVSFRLVVSSSRRLYILERNRRPLAHPTENTFFRWRTVVRAYQIPAHRRFAGEGNKGMTTYSDLSGVEDAYTVV